MSTEIEQQVLGTRRDIFARSEIDILRRLSLFGSAQRQEQRYDSDAQNIGQFALDQLEREETFVRGGVRYRWKTYFDVTAAVEQGRAEFTKATDRDNETKAFIVGIHYDRPRLFVNLSAGRREARPSRADSIFRAVTTPTGSYYAALESARGPGLDFYGHRSLVYGLHASNAYYLETRNGVGLTIPLGRRAGVRFHTEMGDNAYPVASGAEGIKRSDNVRIAGAGIVLKIYRSAQVAIIASSTRYDSNVDLDRSILRITTTVSFRGDTPR